jgi:hypothetical protein
MEITRRPSNRTVQSLGKTVYETKPNVSNLGAGVILAVLLVGGGFLLAGHMLRQMFFDGGNRPDTASDWFGAILLAVIGCALVVGGALLFLRMKSLFGFRLSVCEEGFYFSRGGAESVFAWEEITRVHETTLHEKLPLVKGPARQLMPTKTSRSYTVVRCDGEEFRFDQNVIPRTSLLAGPLSSAAKKHGFAWETTEEKG